MKLFFYGTLKRGQCRNCVLDKQIFLGEVKTKPKYALYRVASFPGLVQSNSDETSVKGELWEVDNDCLEVVDRIEGHPVLFKREPIDLENGEQAEAYFWQGTTLNLENIGDCWV